MANLKIKFIYNNVQVRSDVVEVHKGPVRLNNLYDSYLQPEYEEISYSNSEQKSINHQILPQISQVQVNTKPNSPQVQSLLRHKSAESFFVNRHQSKFLPTFSNNAEDLQQADHKIVNINPKKLRQTNQLRQSKPQLKMTQEEIQKIVLKAPSYKYKPQNDTNQDERGIFKKKQYTKTSHNQKYLYSGIPTKNQNDFIGCFGCFDNEAKSYKVHP